MRIIAESGATKTDWRALLDDGTVVSERTAGLNPMMQSDEDIRAILSKVLPAMIPSGTSVSEIFFYGAGLLEGPLTRRLEDALRLWCPFAMIECRTDLYAAARALFGNGSGVAAIIGTGSNSCLCENGQIIKNIRAGGFVLGDEGSGAYLGKVFLSDYIKGLVPEHLAEAFADRYGLDYAGIVARVYREEAPSRFLASFAPFLMEFKDDPYVCGLLVSGFRAFFERALSRYGNRDLGVVGSFGAVCSDILSSVAEEYGMRLVRIVASPIYELVEYHRNGL